MFYVLRCGYRFCCAHFLITPFFTIKNQPPTIQNAAIAAINPIKVDNTSTGKYFTINKNKIALKNSLIISPAINTTTNKVAMRALLCINNRKANNKVGNQYAVAPNNAEIAALTPRNSIKIAMHPKITTHCQHNK